MSIFNTRRLDAVLKEYFGFTKIWIQKEIQNFNFNKSQFFSGGGFDRQILAVVFGPGP